MNNRHFLWGISALIVFLCVITANPAAAQYPDSTAVPFRIELPRYHEVELGSRITIPIKKAKGSEPIYGFDFLLSYDTAMVKFAGAYRPQLFSQPGAYEWEYLAVDPSVPAECPPTGYCALGRLRITGIADIDNGDHHPLQYNVPDDTTLCNLTFDVSSDSILECMATAISFYWQTCNDNTILIDTAAGLRVVSRAVADYDMGDISNPEYGLPGLYGVPDSCLLSASLPEGARFIDFYIGVVDIICHDSIDSRGDINCNGIKYEAADWVMFTNYFLAGSGSFGSHVECSKAASDINGDGVRLQLEDLIFLRRIICGDTVPLSLKSRYRSVPDSITFVQDVGTRTISVEYPDTLAAVYIVFEGNIEPLFLLDTTAYYCSYQYDGQFTAVLVQYGPRLWNPSDCGTGFTAGPLFTYTGNGLLTHEGSEERKTSAATFDDHVFPDPTFNISYPYDGSAVVEPDTLLWGLARISNDPAPVTIYVGGFTAHSAEDVDPASVRVNDSIVPMSVEVVPSHPEFSGSVLKITVPAIAFMASFGERPFYAPINGPPLWLMTDFKYMTMVGGEFTDGSSFASLGGIILADRPTAISVPSGWPTIAQAVDTARGGDTIMIGDGVYTGDGSRDVVVGKSLVITSEHGPENAIIDCQGSAADPHFAFDFSGTYDSLDAIEGLTITGAYTMDGAPIRKNRGRILLRNCVIHHNQGFEADQPGPIVEIGSYSGELTAESCAFTGNSGSFILYNRGTTIVHNAIFAFNDGNPMNALQDMTCTDIYGNSLGDWSGYIGIDGNISADPLFCDTAAGDYHLSGFSPCLPAGNDCQEIIGVYGMGCGIVCGEINGDAIINIADVVYLINYIFRDGPPPVNLSAADTNANGDVDVGDAVVLVNYIFRNEPVINCLSQ